MLKSIATVFYPLGVFTPATLQGKLFLQDLWVSKKEWDEKLDEITERDGMYLHCNHS